MFAENKISGSKNQITVTNDKGRFSKADIERLAREDERYKLEDEEHKKKVELWNSFEEYMKDMRNAICGKRPSAGKMKIDAAVNKASQWLDSNELGDLDEINDQMKELENVC